MSFTAASMFLGRLGYYKCLDNQTPDKAEQSALKEAAHLVAPSLDDPESMPDLRNLVTQLVDRFRRAPEARDLQLAAHRAQDMVAATPRSHPDYMPRVADWISLMLAMLAFEGFQDEELEKIVSLARQAGFILKLEHWVPLGFILFQRFQTTESMEELEKCIEFFEMTVNNIARNGAGRKDRSGSLTTLGGLYGQRFKRTGSELDLENSIRLSRQAIDLMANSLYDMNDLSHLAASLSALETTLSERFKRFGRPEDLDEAIFAAEMALNLTLRDDKRFSGRVNALGLHLSDRFDWNRTTKDLDQAIEYIEEAVSISTSEGVHDRVSYFNNLGLVLGTRFRLSRRAADFDRAFKVLQAAVEMAPPQHSLWCKSLTNFASLLAERFKQSGEVPDIDRAIEMLAKAIEATPKGQPDRVDRVHNLGLFLSKRASHNGSKDDIDDSIKLLQEALAALPDNHPDRVGRLITLGKAFDTRCHLKIDLAHDYGDGINTLKEAASLATPGHPLRTYVLNNLGCMLSNRARQAAVHQKQYGLTDSVIDDKFVEVIAMLRESIDAAREIHADSATNLGNLGNTLLGRFEHNRRADPDILRDATDAMESAISARHPLDPARAMNLSSLGDMLSLRHRLTGEAKDLTGALKCYKDGWQVLNAPPYIRIDLAKDAAKLLAQQSSWEESASLLEDAINFLPAVTPKSLRQSDKENILARFADVGLASLAAAAALNAGKSAFDALRLLELGRGVISNSFLDMRGDISDLRAKHPSLAARFTSLRDELESPGFLRASKRPSEDVSAWELHSRARDETVRKFNEVISEINAHEGFRHFCGAPDEDELQQAAIPGPIAVINATEYRCDAFLVQPDGIRVLRLNDLTIQKIATYWEESTDREAVMESLWTSIASPCLKALGFNTPICDEEHAEWPHVWWILTGYISELPIHAAGRHRQNRGETVLDRVMSSYATSIRSMIHARRTGAPTEAVVKSSDTALLLASRSRANVTISMPATPGLRHDGILQWAQREINVVERTCLSLGLQTVTPESRKDKVLEGMQSCKIFHFAGHGNADRSEPSQSLLLLEDWRDDALTAGDIRDCRIQEKQPFLAYLSACSTGQTVSTRLKDEGIHLISALQLAGFRHVVGTLWDVSDPYCVEVARIFYETLEKWGITDQAICLGLHIAMRRLRHLAMNLSREDCCGEDFQQRKAYCLEDESLGSSFTNYHWIPYVHYGV